MLKIAVLSDIHGNLAALDAVIADAEARGADRFVNLGDICSGGLHPRQTAARLMALDWPTIRGNHERQATTQPLDRMGLSDRHAATTLTAAQLAWLADLPPTLRPHPDVLMVHGTPGSDLEYFLETVTPEGLRRATRDEATARAGDAAAAVILCGHTHLQRSMRLDDGRLIVNPGSVGLQAYDDDRPCPHVVEAGSPEARYAIVSDVEGVWGVAFHAVIYDWKTAARQALANGREDWARALTTGRV